MAIWVNGGKLVVDASKKPVNCTPCPCGGPSECVYYEADLTVADTSALDADEWDEDSGDWEIASNILKTADADAILYPLVAGVNISAQMDHGHVVVNFLCTEDDDELVLGNNTLSSRGNVVLKVGPDAELWFGTRDGSTKLISCLVTAATDVSHELRIDCGIVYLNGSPMFNIVDQNNTGNNLYIGTGNLTGELQISSYIIYKDDHFQTPNDCDTCVECPLFRGEAPATITVDVAGHVDGVNYLWGNLNGTYVLSRCSGYDRDTNEYCYYTLTDLAIPFEVGGRDIETFEIKFASSGGIDAYFNTQSFGCSASPPGDPACNVSYSLNTDAPCAGEDGVQGYSSSGCDGGDVDPGNTQAGSTVTINL